jgi:hypothetical protein
MERGRSTSSRYNIGTPRRYNNGTPPADPLSSSLPQFEGWSKKKTTPASPLLSPQTREISFHPIGWVGGGVLLEVFYGAQYDHILPYEKDSYVNIGRLRFIYTTEMLISIME